LENNLEQASLETKESLIKKYILSTLYFYLTKGCNLRCRHCWVGPGYQTEGKTFPALDLGLFKKIIEQAIPMGLTRVKLTGGEPFLHPQINEILDFVKIKDLGLSVETNGVLCTPELAKKMAAGKGAFVSVSLDGPDAQTHEWVRGVKGCFEEAKKGILNLVSVGIKPQIIMALMRRNVHYVQDVVRLANSLGASSVKFNVVSPLARAEKLAEEGEVLSAQEIIDLGRWVENILSSSVKIPLIYSWPMAFRSLKNMFGPEGGGCGRCGIFNILGVLGDGSYALCGIGETVPELIFGNASSDRLEDVWNNSPTLKEIRENIPTHFEGVCNLCLMKHRCLGYCVAENYFFSKRLNASFWLCNEVYRLGLFPKSRLLVSGN
jgi:SynChlorMet cassette radical SAM/SPASM protein ScmF